MRESRAVRLTESSLKLAELLQRQLDDAHLVIADLEEQIAAERAHHPEAETLKLKLLSVQAERDVWKAKAERAGQQQRVIDSGVV